MTLYMTLKDTLQKNPQFFDKQKFDKAFFEQLRKDCKAFEQDYAERFEIGYDMWTVGDRLEVQEAFDEVIGMWSCKKSVMEDYKSFEEMREHYLKKFHDRMISLGDGLVLFDNGDLD